MGKNTVRLESSESQDYLDEDDTARLATSSSGHHLRSLQSRTMGEAEPSTSFGGQENESGVIRSPRTSREWGTEGTESKCFSIRALASGGSTKKDPAGRTHKASSSSILKRQDPDGIIMRQDDLLDRTFDNVEIFLCKDQSTRSPRRGPPPPVFSCAGSSALHNTAFSSEAVDLSNAKHHDDILERTFDNVEEVFVCKDQSTRSPRRGPPPPPVFSCADSSALHSTAFSSEVVDLSNAKRHDDLLERTFDNVEVFVCKDQSTRSPQRGPPPPVFSCADISAPQYTGSSSEVVDPSKAKQHDDLLDRTFDNVEGFICKDQSTRSPRRGPPPPLFSCVDSSTIEPGASSSEGLALSNARRLGNAIEMSDGGDIDLGSYTDDFGTVNSIVDETNSVPDLIGSRRSDRAQAHGQMLRSLITTANGILCRDPRVSTVQSPRVNDVNLEKGEDKASSINLQDAAGGDNNAKCGANSFGSFINRQLQLSSMRSGGYPSQNEACEPSSLTKTRRTVPSAGTILLPDGTMLSPSEYKAEQHQIRKQHQGQNLSCEQTSLRMSRENSLLDLEIGLDLGVATAPSSGEDDEDDRLAQLRQKKRSIESTLSRRTDVATTHTVIIPRNHVSKALDPTEGGGEGSPISVQQIERIQYWKQVIFALSLLLVSCAMVIFAISFFLPTDS
jgi:hypothetical protein